MLSQSVYPTWERGSYSVKGESRLADLGPKPQEQAGGTGWVEVGESKHISPPT